MGSPVVDLKVLIGRNATFKNTCSDVRLNELSNSVRVCNQSAQRLSTLASSKSHTLDNTLTVVVVILRDLLAFQREL